MCGQTTYNITIEQQDTDLNYRASISTFIGKILNVAGLDADSKGFGVGELNTKSRSWVLSRFAMEVQSLPKAFDHINIKTWIADCNRLMSTRKFIIYDSQGGKIAEAISQWCMIDLETRKAVDLSSLPEGYKQYVLGEMDATIARCGKIPAPTPQVAHSHSAVYSDIDFNGHVNALRYVDLMLDRLPIAMLTGERAVRVDLHFMHESYYGDTLNVNYQDCGDVALLEVVRGVDTTAVRCRLEWL